MTPPCLDNGARALVEGDPDLRAGGLAGLDDRVVEGRAFRGVAVELVLAQVVCAHGSVALGELDVHEGAIVARHGSHGGARDALAPDGAIAPVEGSLPAEIPGGHANHSEHHE